MQTYPVHPSKAIFEVLDLNRMNGPVDLSFGGAGVGSSAMMEQLRPLGTLCIDAGFGLDALAYPVLRWKRPYCVPDVDFDLRKIEYFPETRKTHALRRFGDLTGTETSR